MKTGFTHFSGVTVLALVLAGCSSAPGKLSIVAKSGDLSGVAGDAIALEVMAGEDVLPADAKVTWSGVPTVTALDPGSTAASPLPTPGAEPTAVFIANPSRSDIAQAIADVLFLLDPGSKGGGEVELTATVSGSVDGTASLSIPVGPTPEGDATRGSSLYERGGADCAFCHGATASGSPAGPDGKYTYDGAPFPYPAPALDAAPGNLAGDPAWSAATLAMSSRACVNHLGVAIRVPMPTWLVQPNTATNQPLSTQDFADIHAFLGTQHP